MSERDFELGGAIGRARAGVKLSRRCVLQRLSLERDDNYGRIVFRESSKRFHIMTRDCGFTIDLDNPDTVQMWTNSFADVYGGFCADREMHIERLEKRLAQIEDRSLSLKQARIGFAARLKRIRIIHAGEIEKLKSELDALQDSVERIKSIVFEYFGGHEMFPRIKRVLSKLKSKRSKC